MIGGELVCVGTTKLGTGSTPGVSTNLTTYAQRAQRLESPVW